MMLCDFEEIFRSMILGTIICAEGRRSFRG